MEKTNLMSSHPKKTVSLKLSSSIAPQEATEKIATINKFMKDRKKWEKGLFTSKTILA